MRADELITQMHRWVAYTSVGPSTVRGQRSPGLVANLRQKLAEIDLAKFAGCSPPDFPDLLDAQTASVKRHMPSGIRHWGIARKVLNIFLRGATYNCYLRHAYNLGGLEDMLELPLDSLTVQGLKARSPQRSLPRWHGVRHLTKGASDRFQDRASEIAREHEVSRVHLDIFLWLER